MRLARCILILALPLLLSACGGPAEPVWAPESEVQRASYSHGGPPTLTLFTVTRVLNGSGMHSGLLINGRERILFDPAGTFKLPFVPERNDVHFGMTENALKVYIDYHARETFDVRIQEVPVSAGQAEAVARAVKEYGAVPKAQCSLSITRILAGIPGFESIPVGYFPNKLSKAFGALPGASTRVVTDDDADQNHNVLFTATKRGT